MNIIFLDIDNVLNYGFKTNDRTEEQTYGFAPELLANLKYILDSVQNTKIVISSSWRMTRIMEHISKDVNWRNILEQRLGCTTVGGIIIGDIPHNFEYPGRKYWARKRGDDIKSWLNMNAWQGIDSFVILDDNISCGNIPEVFPKNFVNVDELKINECLSKRNSDRAIKILKTEKFKTPFT